MKGTGKFLTAVFIILFVVLLGELGYILYSTSQPKNQPTKNQPFPTLTIDQAGSLEAKKVNESQAIDENMLAAISKAKRGVLLSSILEITYQGRITELTFDDEGMKLRITGANGESNGFFYSTEQIKELTFNTSSLLTKETRPIAPSDLAMGDLIRVEGKMDMLKDLNSAFFEGRITVITQ